MGLLTEHPRVAWGPLPRSFFDLSLILDPHCSGSVISIVDCLDGVAQVEQRQPSRAVRPGAGSTAKVKKFEKPQPADPTGVPPSKHLDHKWQWWEPLDEMERVRGRNPFFTRRHASTRHASTKWQMQW